MNALYVTVSIPLLLVLAGFNNAHGLTTFGKSNNQQGNSPSQPVVQGKHCTNQADCALIKNTTCLKTFCLCGDNSYPINGECNVLKKGHGHICVNNDECVEDAQCEEPKEKYKPNSALATSITSQYKICQCEEGLSPTPTGTCSSGRSFVVFPALMLVLLVTAKVY